MLLTTNINKFVNGAAFTIDPPNSRFIFCTGGCYIVVSVTPTTFKHLKVHPKLKFKIVYIKNFENYPYKINVLNIKPKVIIVKDKNMTELIVCRTGHVNPVQSILA